MIGVNRVRGRSPMLGDVRRAPRADVHCRHCGESTIPAMPAHAAGRPAPPAKRTTYRQGKTMIHGSNELYAAMRRRRDRTPRAHPADSYGAPVRLKSGMGCTECGALYDDGRWSWHATAGALLQIVCPACRRIRERASAGELVLAGGYFARRRDDIVALLRRHAGDDLGARPLERLLSIDALPARMVVRTTGSHLVHRLSEALVRAHCGDLEIDYREGEDVLRARWMRETA
ncbi:hypothetical protein A33K_16281 [Burkholderia humptydooensis MSMB43]|nr:hypothetical protein A33K_16281 [Burkholderia humptydooensis MSMB43]